MLTRDVSIVPFRDDLIPAAGSLLASRHRAWRLARPELPARYEDPSEASAAVRSAWGRVLASGVAALRGDDLIAYLVGDVIVDPLWGRAGWVRLAGCALLEGEDPEIVGDLYAALGARWLEYGCFAHFAVMPKHDPALLDAWFRLSFGVEQVHAALDLESLDFTSPAISQPRAFPPVFRVRRTEPTDREALAGLSDVIWRHQVGPPVWGIALPESEAEDRADWGALVDDPDATVWLAEREGKVVGSIAFFPAEAFEDALLVSEESAYLTVAGVREEARGGGIGLALTRHGLKQARLSGIRHIVTNWRSANLLASRFWPRQGFETTAYRLVRRIDPRIAWANGTARPLR